uniref:Uncharacterized protein n=1 Tax=Oryza punctata TaxID=4537 RepID=A0A0E0K0W1_ORYPU
MATGYNGVLSPAAATPWLGGEAANDKRPPDLEARTAGSTRGKLRGERQRKRTRGGAAGELSYRRGRRLCGRRKLVNAALFLSRSEARAPRPGQCRWRPEGHRYPKKTLKERLRYVPDSALAIFFRHRLTDDHGHHGRRSIS